MARATARRRTPWWGDGPSPAEAWPGTTIDIAARWSSAKGGRWESHRGRYFFDAEAADGLCRFFPAMLKHHIGEFAGQPFDLLDYQAKLIVRPLWGWRRVSDGRRRFTKAFIFLPKGNGKSPLGAGLGVFGALCDQEPAAEVYCVAADREQARIVHDNAKIMVEGNDELLEGAEILKDSIYWSASKSVYKVLSSEAATKHGFRPHIVIFDEIHAQKDRALYEALSRSMVKRRQPLMIIFTHAGVDDEGIGYEEYEYARGVLRGANPDEACLPVIFEADSKDDWADPAVLQRVNPGYGVTIQAAGLARSAAEAKSEPRKLNDHLMFHLNRWVNQAVAWLPIDWWDNCRVDTLDDAHLQTLTCAAGLDLAQKWDLAAFVVVFSEPIRADGEAIEVVARDEADGTVVTKSVDLNFRLTFVPFFWIPENTMREHEKLDGVPYSRWVELGLVTATEGDVIDYTRIYQDITGKILARFPRLKSGTIGYDPAFATDIATKLRDLAGLSAVEVRQNYTDLSEPSQVFEALVRGRRAAHDGHRTLRSHIENVAVKRDDAGRIRPVKPKKASKRIDGVVASIMGTKMVMRSIVSGDEAARDFEDRGLFV
jgi:phage terminase large subunit-like protein